MTDDDDEKRFLFWKSVWDVPWWGTLAIGLPIGIVLTVLLLWWLGAFDGK